MLLEHGADLDLEDARCNTPLFYAARHGHEHIVKQLIGKVIRCRNTGSRSTPLVAAAERGFDKIIELLARDPRVALDGSGWDNVTPLAGAVRTGQMKSVRCLIDAGADASNGLLFKTTCENGHVPLAECLINSGCRFPYIEALWTTIQHGRTHLFKFLLQYLEPADEAYWTELERHSWLDKEHSFDKLEFERKIAAESATPYEDAGCLEGYEFFNHIFRLLSSWYNLEADILLALTTQETFALFKYLHHITTSSNFGKVTDPLVQRWFYPSQVPCLYTLAAASAAAADLPMIDLLRVMLQLDNMDARGLVGGILKASEQPYRWDFADGIRLLFANASPDWKRSIDYTRPENATPLIRSLRGRFSPRHYKLLNQAVDMAAKNGNDDLFDMLLDAGASFSWGARMGDLLIGASEQGSVRIVQAILNARPKPKISPEDLAQSLIDACREDHDVIMKLLKDAGGNVNINNGKALCDAADRQNVSSYSIVENIKRYIEAGADVNVNNGDHALYAATRHGDYRIVELLIKADADVNAESREGTTALEKAIWNEDERIVRLLLENGADIRRIEDTFVHYAAEHGDGDKICRLIYEWREKQQKEQALIEATSNAKQQKEKAFDRHCRADLARLL